MFTITITCKKAGFKLRTSEGHELLFIRRSNLGDFLYDVMRFDMEVVVSALAMLDTDKCCEWDYSKTS